MPRGVLPEAVLALRIRTSRESHACVNGLASLTLTLEWVVSGALGALDSCGGSEDSVSLTLESLFSVRSLLCVLIRHTSIHIYIIVIYHEGVTHSGPQPTL